MKTSIASVARLTVLTFIAFLVGVAGEFANAQDAGKRAPEEQPTLRPTLLFRLSPDGRLRPLVVGTMDWETPLFEPDILRDDALREELDLVDFQVADIDKILSKYDRTVARLQQGLSRGDGPKTILEFQRRSRQAREDATRRLKAVLLPMQRRRIDQLVYRCRIRRSGLVRHIIKELTSRPGNHSADVTALRQHAARLAVTLRKEMVEERIGAIDELLSVLSGQQRGKLKEILGPAYYGNAPDLELLILQLGFQSKRAGADAGKDPLSSLTAPDTFQLTFDGRLVARSRKNREITPYLIELLSTDAMQKVLELSDSQIDDIDALAQELRDLRARRSAELTRVYQPGGVAGERPAAEALIEIWKKERSRLYRRLRSRLQSLLTAHQEERLIRFAQQAGVARRGHLASLLDGALHQTVRVTESQERRLVETAKKVRKRLIERSSELEAMVYRRLLEKVPATVRSDLQAGMGAPIRGFPGALTVLAADLAGELSFEIARHEGKP